jgi:predicted transcriptional regulator YheO
MILGHMAATGRPTRTGKAVLLSVLIARGPNQMKRPILNLVSDLKGYFPICDALAVIFGQQIEVVIHDLRTGRVAYIVNPYSGRKVGVESLLDIEKSEIPETASVLGPYEKAGSKGERIRSVTAVLRDPHREPIALLCVNFNFEVIDKVVQSLEALFPTEGIIPHPDMLFRQDWRERVNLVIRDFLLRTQTTVATLDRQQRSKLLEEIENSGLLEMRHAAQYVANQLGISRATLYLTLGKKRDRKHASEGLVSRSKRGTYS